jgi:hypothetical protein
MNGRAWVVEWQTTPDGKWEPRSIETSRKEARHTARIFRAIEPKETRTRVRQYIRQPEVRP